MKHERDHPGRGRRPLDDEDPSVPVSFRLPSRQLDDLIERARLERVTVGELIRRSIEAGRPPKSILK